MENCLKARKCVVGKENVSQSITLLNKNAIYYFGSLDGSFGGITIKLHQDLNPQRKKRLRGAGRLNSQMGYY